MSVAHRAIHFAASIGRLDLRICVRDDSPAVGFAKAVSPDEKVVEVLLRPGETYLGFTSERLQRNGFQDLDELVAYLATSAPHAIDVRTALLRHAEFSPGTYLFYYQAYVPRGSSDPVVSVTYGPRDMMEILRCNSHFEHGKMYKMTS